VTWKSPICQRLSALMTPVVNRDAAAITGWPPRRPVDESMVIAADE